MASGPVQGHQGLFGVGGAFNCTDIQVMEPDRAGAALAELGYDVIWQVEDRDAGTSQQTTEAPSDGYIVEGVLLEDKLLLVVERGAIATPSGRTGC
jgi:hypothetical protein